MRVALPTEGGRLSGHFGHCAQFTLAEVEPGRVLRTWSVEAPPHEPGAIPRFLADQGVECVIAGGMGMRARQMFESWGIVVIVGAEGEVKQVLEDFVHDRLRVGENLCDH